MLEVVSGLRGLWLGGALTFDGFADAAYVALAEALDCPLVTVDRRLRSLAGVSCMFLPAERPTR